MGSQEYCNLQYTIYNMMRANYAAMRSKLSMYVYDEAMHTQVAIARPCRYSYRQTRTEQNFAVED